ncbi:MAG: iron-containing alcohol dehydrogenase, partial [Proteobacteria bacterium]|nr:iron-containing alcohol dehydrogenase [Pseudomonadota bacterium]
MDEFFRFQSTPRLVFGQGALAELGREVTLLGGRRVLIVADQALVEYTDKVRQELDRMGLAA